VRTSSQALMQISRGSLTAKKAFQTGQLIVSKGEGDPYEAVQVIHKMFFQQEIVS
jgi:putative sterol carrier protein